jgi:uncharacterized membrane protein
MEDKVATTRVWTKLVGGLALGAAAMYVLDPDHGRRRRALARDKAGRIARQAGDAWNAGTRDLGSRLRGMSVQVNRALRKETSSGDDDVLVNRVRSRVGRVAAHPRAIHLEAYEGRVVLRGAVLTHEHIALLDAVRSVPGVKSVDDHLEAHDHPGHISSLQGNHRNGRTLGEYWQPGARVAATLSGGTLAWYGLARRGVPGSLAALAGLGLIARGMTNVPMPRLVGVRARRAIEVQKTIDIAASPEQLFDLWSDYENFPRFMAHVKEVRDLGGGRSHWVLEGPAGALVEWDSVIVRKERPRTISWKSDPESAVRHSGSIRFEPSSKGTRLTLKTSYTPSGAAGSTFAALMGGDIRHEMEENLARVKEVAESEAKAGMAVHHSSAAHASSGRAGSGDGPIH